MSIESAKQFISEMSSNQSKFQNIFKNTFSKFESKDAKLEYITAKAKELGFNFNSADLQKALSNIKNFLSPQELANVAGGTDFSSLIDSKSIDPKNLWNSLL